MDAIAIDNIRRQAAKLRVMMLNERNRLAEQAGRMKTGELANQEGAAQHELLLKDMLLLDQDASIIEAMEKNLF